MAGKGGGGNTRADDFCSTNECSMSEGAALEEFQDVVLD